MFRYAVLAVALVVAPLTVQAANVCKPLNTTINSYLKEIALASAKGYLVGTGQSEAALSQEQNALRIIKLNVDLLVKYDCEPRALPIDPKIYRAEAISCAKAKGDSSKCDMPNWSGKALSGNASTSG